MRLLRLALVVCLATAASVVVLAQASSPPPGRGERPPRPGPEGGPPPEEIVPPSLSGVWILDRERSDDVKAIFADVFRDLPASTGQGQKPGGRPGGGMGGGMGGMGGASGGMGSSPGGMGGMGGPPSRGGRGGGSMFDSNDLSGGMERPAQSENSGPDDEQAARRRQQASARLATAWDKLMISHEDTLVEVIDALEREHHYTPFKGPGRGGPPPPGAPGGQAPQSGQAFAPGGNPPSTPPTGDGGMSGRPPAEGRGERSPRGRSMAAGQRGPRDTSARPAEIARWEQGRLVVESRLENGQGVVTTYERDLKSDRLLVTIAIKATKVARDRTIRLIYRPA